MTGMSCHLNHLPRIFVTPSLWPVRAREADTAESADGLRADDGKLPVQELAADLHLIGFRSAIFRRPALHHVADIDVFAEDFDAFLFRRVFDHLCEQLPGAADERDALRVLIGARTFADEDQRRFGIADAEDDLVAALMQAAAAAVADVFDDFEKRIVGRGEGRKVHSDDGTSGRWQVSRAAAPPRLPVQGGARR